MTTQFDQVGQVEIIRDRQSLKYLGLMPRHLAPKSPLLTCATCKMNLPWFPITTHAAALAGFLD